MFQTAAHAINDTHDEQSNDRHRQSDKYKRQRGTDDHCEHEDSPDFTFLALQPGSLSSKKSCTSRDLPRPLARDWGPIYAGSMKQETRARTTLGDLHRNALDHCE